ncbi:MAG: esterase/lipase family protein [Pseudomonadales bacterium]
MKPPHWSLALTEAPRALIDITSLQLSKCLLRKAPRGDGHGVMVIPGFMGDDPFNRPLVKFLNGLGYRAIGWQMGRNLGPRSFSADDLRLKLENLARAGDGTVSLIGHSLGGIYAREMARLAPDSIRQVISLGSPFGEGNDSGSHASRLYKRLNPDREVDPELLARREQIAEAPPVPTTSIYTKGDGIVNWRTTVQSKDHEQTQNIQVIGSHTGLTLNPAVWYLLADRLRHTANTWQHFESAFFNHH